MNEDFFKIISCFADAGARPGASGELAKMLDAEEIFWFLFDPVVNAYLPAPGFSQTLKNAKEWQRFLAPAQNKSFFKGNIVLPGNIKKKASGISLKNGCVLVLINWKHDDII